MKYRLYEPNDLSYVVEMYRQLRIDEQQPDPRSDAEICNQFSVFLNDDGYQCYFCEDVSERGQVQLLGYMLFKESTGGIFLKHLFILEHYRRQGHARKFLTDFIAEQWSGKSVSLEVLAINEAAIAFYGSMGFMLHSHLYTRPSID